MKHCFRLLAPAALATFVMGMNIALAGASNAPQAAIAPQPLGDALQEWAVLNRKQLIFDAGLTAGKQTRGAAAGLNGIEALSRLLDGTGLAYRVLNDRTISILPVANAAKEPAKAAVAPSAQAMRLAQQVETRKVEMTPSAEPAEASEAKGIPEMLVKGARTSNIDIQRTKDDVQPYVVFTADDIEHSMAGSLDQFLMSRLPMNTSQYAASVPTGIPLNGNQSSIDLRGLGANQTLILVNGRRVPGVGSSNTLSQSDINGIPMSSVERIEVLPSTAGGIYGGGATGGVINIILKDDYQGFEINARYDGTFRQDAQQRVLEASAGFSLEDGRTTIMLSGSHQDSTPLLHSDRDFAARGRELLMVSNPSLFTGTSIPLGNTTNIRSANGTPLILAAGNLPLGSAITHVPYGYAGPASDGGAALRANAGSYNLDVSDGAMGLRRALTGSPAVDSLRLNVRRHFTDWIEAFLDASYSTNDSTAEYGSTPNSFTSIPVGTPNNPFTTPISIRYSANDYHRSTEVLANSQVLNATGGVIVRLPRNWTVQGEYGQGSSERDSFINQMTGIYAPYVANGSLNVLADESIYPNDYSPFYGTEQFTSYQPRPQGASMRNLTLRLAGPTLTLPGGPVMLSALMERRRDETTGSIFGSLSFSTFEWRYNYHPPRKQTTDGAYAELTMPLFSAANALPLVRALDLQLSYRRDRIGARTVSNNSQTNLVLESPDSPIPEIEYLTNHVEADQYTIGLRYQPFEALTLRVSNAVGVLPPSLQQLVPTIAYNVNGGNTLTDPLRGGSLLGILGERRTSGNPDLLPEHSDSWSAGAIFTPALLPGLRLSVDYTRIEKTDEISMLAAQVILDRQSLYPDRIGRLPLTEADQLDGHTVGRINYVDFGMTNIAHTKVEAVDYRIEYRWTTRHGAFRAEAIATNQVHLEKQLLSTSPMMEFMGFSDGPLEWRGNAGVTWERAEWSLGWNMQYYDAFPVYGTTTSESNRALYIQNQGGEFIPRQIYHDLSFRYRMEEAPLWGGVFANTSFLVGISNVFDSEPPLMLWSANPFTLIPSTTARYGDPRLRRYSISVRKSFK